MSAFLDRLFKRREAATVPSMDGVLRPNALLDGASVLASVTEPDNLVRRGSELVFSSGTALLKLSPGGVPGGSPSLLRDFKAGVTALAASPDGALAVGLAETGVRFVGGARDGLQLDAIGSRPARGPTALAFGDADTLFACIGSAHNGPDDWQRDLMERRASGSVWRIDLRSKAATLVADGLAYPNGVLVQDNGLVVTESWQHRLLHFDGDGRRAAPRVLLDDMPGYPGRLAADGSGGAWLAVFAPRSQLIEFVLRERGYCARMLRELPKEFWVAPSLRSGLSFREPMQGGAVRVHGIVKPWAPTRSYGLVIQLDKDMQPIRSFHSRADGNRHGVVSVCEWRGEMVFASRGNDLVGALALSRTGADR